MPIRVLDRYGEGDSVNITAGIRWAVEHGANVINLSFEFDDGDASTRRGDPGHPGRAALRAAARRRRGRGVRQRGRSPRSPTPRGTTRCRSARRPSTPATPTTPTRARASTSSPRAAARTRPERPVVPAGAPSGRGHLPDDVPGGGRQRAEHRVEVPALRAAAEVHRHLDGRAARRGDGRARHRLRHPRPAPERQRGASAGSRRPRSTAARRGSTRSTALGGWTPRPRPIRRLTTGR